MITNEFNNKHYLDEAFNLLAFTCRLSIFLDDNYSSLPMFDLEEEMTVVYTGNDEVFFPKEDYSKERLKLLSVHNLKACWSNAAIVLHQALKQEYKAPKNLDSLENKVGGLIHMIRCCVAHGPTNPKWKIDYKYYEAIYDLPGIYADLTSLNGKKFEYEHIGGFSKIFALRMVALNLKMIRLSN